jgi:hypothetical protein
MNAKRPLIRTHSAMGPASISKMLSNVRLVREAGRKLKDAIMSHAGYASTNSAGYA